MAVNKKRAKQFNADLLDLEKSLEFEQFYETVKAKLLDLISKGDLGGDTLQVFRRQVGKVLGPEFNGFVDRIYNVYTDTVSLVNTHYKDLGVDVNRDLDRIQAIEKVNLTRLGAYESSVERGIAKQVREGIAAGERSDKIADRLADLDDRVNSFANTLARTQVKSYGRSLKGEKARIAEIFFYEYIGLKRANTRRFCSELLDQNSPVFHMNDIRQMKNAQVGNVFDYCGGFNCHHDWEPDPFVKKDGYSVSFYTVQVNKRELKLARS